MNKRVVTAEDYAFAMQFRPYSLEELSTLLVPQLRILARVNGLDADGSFVSRPRLRRLIAEHLATHKWQPGGVVVVNPEALRVGCPHADPQSSEARAQLKSARFRA